MRTMAAAMCLVALGWLGPACASAAQDGWYAAAGVAGSDVGLDEGRLGPALEVGRVLPIPGSAFDFLFYGEYIQKAGNQKRWFQPADDAGFVGDEELILHYLQPALGVGYSFPALPVRPRLYLAAAMALKVSESWTRPVEDGLEIVGYEDTDFLLHAGAALDWRGWSLDVRWEQGLTAQLLIDEGIDPLAKADDPLADVDDPEEGAKITSWRVGIARSF